MPGNCVSDEGGDALNGRISRRMTGHVIGRRLTNALIQFLPRYPAEYLRKALHKLGFRRKPRVADTVQHAAKEFTYSLGKV